MSEGIRRIFYDNTTGERIVEIGRGYGMLVPNVDQDILTYKALSERNRNTFSNLDLPFDKYARDFAECISYRINPETKVPEFRHPDPNSPIVPPPYQKPLTEQIADLKERQAFSEEAIDFLLMNGGLL